MIRVNPLDELSCATRNDLQPGAGETVSQEPLPLYAYRLSQVISRRSAVDTANNRRPEQTSTPFFSRLPGCFLRISY
jgi:hypothetical protein